MEIGGIGVVGARRHGQGYREYAHTARTLLQALPEYETSSRSELPNASWFSIAPSA
jgi:hypothetical protein